MKPFDQLTRSEVYNLVWSEALVTLAPRLGITDVALKKRCRKLGVPTPARGYWAKIHAGRRVAKTPLPETWTVERAKQRLPQSADAVRQFEPPLETYPTNKLAIEAMATLKELRAGKPSERGRVYAGGAGVLKTSVSPRHRSRAARLWSHLIGRLGAHGLSLRCETESSVSDGIESVTLELCEKLSAYERPYDPAKDRHYWSGPPATTKVWIASGALAFQAEEIHGAGCSRQWRDTPRGPLDEKIDLVCEGLVALLRRKHEINVEREAERRKWNEEWERKQAEAERRRLESKRLENLLALAQRYDDAERVRRLVAALSAAPDSDHATAFTEWALDSADRIDPRQAIIGSLESGEDPVKPG